MRRLQLVRSPRRRLGQRGIGGIVDKLEGSQSQSQSQPRANKASEQALLQLHSRCIPSFIVDRRRPVRLIKESCTID